MKRTLADIYRMGLISLTMQPELVAAANISKATEPGVLHPAYFETRFRCADLPGQWPEKFAILTGYATTGEQWTVEQNMAADLALLAELEARSCWHHRLTGYSPTTDHAEPSWAAELSFEVACELGQCFRQDAVYFVIKDALYVSHCDVRRMLVPVGIFGERVTVSRL